MNDAQVRSGAADGKAAPAYIQNLGGCMPPAIGAHGLDPATLQRYVDRLAAKLDGLKSDYETGALPILRISEETADIEAAEAAMARLADGASTIVFFGTGGSSLGGQTLAQLSGWNVPGTADEAQRRRPRTRFYDNLDATTLAAALATLDLPSTRFVVTSKSGGTVETLTQAVAALATVKKAGYADRIPAMFLGLTEPDKPGQKNGLRALFAAHAIPMLEHHTGIGGRFSVLTNVGMLPAIARGLDVRAVRRGAASVVSAMREASHPRVLAPALGAAAVVALAETKGVRAEIMMSYCDRLGRFGAWFVQLWAESLGKAGQGTTPIACLGPLDQHSQLQLFMDGPRDHLVTVMRTPTRGTGPVLDADLCRAAGIDFLAGRAMGDLVSAQSKAVPEALLRAGRPVRTFDIPHLDETSMGALFMHFMLETIFAADLFGVDPFDQPAVELAKTLTRSALAQA
ncbi:MAG TPA: glucose-6-phosphate isomerase [Hyphomicrobiaceae bacterium]|nr:glucose-6-phosphate isomerase [Hyphomicrobiaceae bacterium]